MKRLFWVVLLLIIIFAGCATGKSKMLPTASENGACKKSVVYNDYLYFISPNYNGRASKDDPYNNGTNYICKMKLDGSELKTLYQSEHFGTGNMYTTSDIWGIVIKDDELYYYDRNGLGKMTLDGEILHVYENTNYNYIGDAIFHIYYNKIYYISAMEDEFGEDNRNLYCMNIDGSDVQMLQPMAREVVVDEKRELIICIVIGFEEDFQNPKSESIVEMSLDGENKIALVNSSLEWDVRSNGEKYYRTFLYSPLVIDKDIYYYKGISSKKLSCFSRDKNAKTPDNTYFLHNNMLFFLDEEQRESIFDTSKDASIVGVSNDTVFYSLETYEHYCNDENHECDDYTDIYTFQLYELDKKTNVERLVYDIDDECFSRSFAVTRELLHTTEDMLYFDGFILKRDGTGVYFAENENGAMTFYERFEKLSTVDSDESTKDDLKEKYIAKMKNSPLFSDRELLINKPVFAQWHQLGASLMIIPLDDNGEWLLDEYIDLSLNLDFNAPPNYDSYGKNGSNSHFVEDLIEQINEKHSNGDVLKSFIRKDLIITLEFSDDSTIVFDRYYKEVESMFK